MITLHVNKWFVIDMTLVIKNQYLQIVTKIFGWRVTMIKISFVFLAINTIFGISSHKSFCQMFLF